MTQRLIPKALAYARNVRAIENHSFRHWLEQTIQREDLIAWARREEERPLVGCIPYDVPKEPWKRRFISPLIP